MSAADERSYNHLWVAIGVWASAHGAKDIAELPGCWERPFEFDGLKCLASMNGGKEPRKNSEGFTLQALDACLVINGWPAVVVGPGGGGMMGGKPDTEDRLIAFFEKDASS